MRSDHSHSDDMNQDRSAGRGRGHRGRAARTGRGAGPGFEGRGRPPFGPAQMFEPHDPDDGDVRGPFGPGMPGRPGRGGGPGRGGPGRGFGREGFGGRRRGGRRARADVRSAILLLLAEEPMHGYQIIQSLSDRSGGMWRPSPGSIYPTLSQLADEGLVEVTKEEGRNVAHLTDAGREHVEQHRADLGTPWDDVAGSVKTEAGDVAGEIKALMVAVQQVLRVGNADQVAKAGETLAGTRRALYRLLAEEPSAESSQNPAE